MGCDLIHLATPGVASLQPYQPGKSIEDLACELGSDNVIKLASNENPLGPGNQAKQVLSQASNLSSLSRYPDGNGYHLKKLLAEKHGINIEKITLGNGSNEIFELITRALVEPQHEIIFSEHAFAVYALVTQAVGARAVIVPASNWHHDLVAMKAAINKNSRLMFIANPNNPTGTWLDKSALRSLLDDVPEHMVVVIDEAYAEYVLEDDYPNSIQWLHEFKQLLVTRTFSKIFGLAGLRIGYGVSHSSIADLMNRVRQPFNVNSLALIAAAAALEDDHHLQKSASLNVSGMKQMTDAFDNLGLQYIPSVANFVCVNVDNSSATVYEKLLHEGVIVRPLENYDMPNHLRITIGLQEENEKFIKAFEKVMSEMQ